jgi:hypothetical protein
MMVSRVPLILLQLQNKKLPFHLQGKSRQVEGTERFAPTKNRSTIRYSKNVISQLTSTKYLYGWKRDDGSRRNSQASIPPARTMALSHFY